MVGTIAEGPSQGDEALFRFSVSISTEVNPEIPDINTAPYFDPAPVNSYQATAGNNYFVMDLDLPPIIDDENDNVDVEYDFGSLEGYLTASASNDKIIA